MKLTKGKAAAIYALAIVLTFISTIVLLRMDFRQWENKERSLGQIKLDRTAKTLIYLRDMEYSSKASFDRYIRDSLDFMTMALAGFVTEDGYTGPRLFDGGAVVEVSENRVLWPEGIPRDFRALTREDVLRGGQVTVELSAEEDSDSDKTVFASAPIAGDYYYVNWIGDDALSDAQYTGISSGDFLKAAAESFEGEPAAGFNRRRVSAARV